MTTKSRWIIWGILLAGTVLLILADPAERNESPIVDATPAATRPSSASDRGPGRGSALDETPQEILGILPRGPAPKVSDAFPARDWRPAAAKAPAPAPPPAITAPPLPFSFLGKKLEDGQWQVFLERGDRIHVVKTSDTIDNVYRIQAIQPPVMTLIYLPLQHEQRLSIGNAE